MTKEDFRQLLIKSAYDGTFPSWNDEEADCKFRADGTPTCPQRCVIGLCLPDENYEPWMDNYSSSEQDSFDSWSDMVNQAILPKVVIPEGLDGSDLRRLQGIHDSHAFHWNPEEFVKEVNEFFGVKEAA